MSVPRRHVVSRPVLRALRAFIMADRGSPAIEFAIIAPILCLLLVAIVDFGLVFYIRLSLNQSVSASANFAMVNAANVSSGSGAALAGSLAAIIPTGNDATIVVNNGPALRRIGGVVTLSGTAASADLSYCPTVTANVVSWGSPVVRGAACPAGGFGGSFVAVSASDTYAPMFGDYGFVANGTILVRAIVQVR